MRYALRLYSNQFPDRVLGEPETSTVHQTREKVRFYLIALAHQYDRVDVVNRRTGRVLDSFVRHHGLIASRKALAAAVGRRAYMQHRYIVYRNRPDTQAIDPTGHERIICRVHCDDPTVLQLWVAMEWEGAAAAIAYSHASSAMAGKADTTPLVTFPTFDSTEPIVAKRVLKVERALRAKFPNAQMIDHRRREDGADDVQVVLAKVGRRYVTALYAPDNNPVFLPRFSPTARLARADFNARLA